MIEGPSNSIRQAKCTMPGTQATREGFLYAGVSLRFQFVNSKYLTMMALVC